MSKYKLHYLIHKEPLDYMVVYECHLLIEARRRLPSFRYKVHQHYNEGTSESFMDEHFSQRVMAEILPILKRELPIEFQAIVGTLNGFTVREGDGNVAVVMKQADFKPVRAQL